MTRRVFQIAPYILGVILGYFTWPIVEIVFEPARSADVRILSAALSAATILAATLITQTVTHRREVANQQAIRLREIEDSLRDRKVEAYSKLLELVSAYLRGANEGNKRKTPTPQKTLDSIERFLNAIMLWGSPHVIQAWLAYRKNSAEGAPVFEYINKLYLAIREDVGLSNVGLGSYELIQIYLKNPDGIHSLLSREADGGSAASQGVAAGHVKVSRPLHSQGPRHLAVPLCLSLGGASER